MTAPENPSIVIGVNSKLKKCKNHPIKRHFILKYSCKIFNIGRVSTVKCKNSIGLANMQVIKKKKILYRMTGCVRFPIVDKIKIGLAKGKLGMLSFLREILSTTWDINAIYPIHYLGKKWIF